MSTTVQEEPGRPRAARGGARPGAPPRRPKEKVPRRGRTASPAPHRGPTQRPGARAPRMPFVLLVLALLGGALVSMLVLHTILAQDAFTITELQRENRALSQQEEALAEEVLEAESPDELARRAQELGMEPGGAPRFLDPESGEIHGDAEAAD
jgi:hypothetical protein